MTGFASFSKLGIMPPPRNADVEQVTMKKKTRKKAAGYDSLLKSVAGLARETQQLARRAVQEYSPAVEAILRSGCRDTRRIESTLDGLLGFCFDPDVLVIYKKLCRYYYDIDPQATASYVQFYREMWDS